MMHRFQYSSSTVALFAFGGCLLVFSAADVVNAANHECVKGIEVPVDATGNNYSDWPKLFRLTTPNPVDPTASNQDESAGTVNPATLLAAGIVYRYLDPSGFDYPNKTKEVPWSPPVNGTNDATLQQIRDENDYQYADIIHLMEYNEKFYEEHIHASGDEVRYVLDGSGYFDIRDVNDEWVRAHAKTGDFFEFPAGIEHRFSIDDGLYIQAMRLFPGSGEPDWSSVARSQIKGNNTARNDYVKKYLCGSDPDLEHGDEADHDHDHNDEKDESSAPESEDDGDHSDHDHDHNDHSSAFGSEMLIWSSSIIAAVVAGFTAF